MANSSFSVPDVGWISGDILKIDYKTSLSGNGIGAINASLYVNSNKKIAIIDGVSCDIPEGYGIFIGSASVQWTGETSTLEVSKIKPVNADYEWVIGSSGLADFALTSGDDNVHLTDVASGGFTLSDAAAGGNDVVSFSSVENKTISSVSGAVANSGSLTLQSEGGSNYIKLGATSEIESSTVQGSKSGVSLGAGAQQTLAAVETGGVAAITLHGSTADADVTINGGKLTLTGNNGTTKQTKVSVEGGQLAYGTVATFEAGSSIEQASLGTAAVTLDSSGKFNMVGGKILGDFTLKGGDASDSSNIEITSLGGNVKHSIGAAGTINLDISDEENTSKYYYLSTKDDSAGVSIVGGKLSAKAVDNDLSISKQSTDAKVWNFSGSKGDVVAKTESTDADKVTLSGSHVSFSLVTGSGNDSITFGDVMTDTQHISITAGKGDDVYDLSKLATTKTANGIVVTDYGYGGKKNSSSGANGFDKIYAGTGFDPNEAKFTSNGENGTLIVNGVTFTVAEGSYVLIGKGESGSIQYDSYLAQNSTLTLVESNVTPSDGTSGSGYNASDASAVDAYKKASDPTNEFSGNPSDTAGKTEIENLNGIYKDAEKTDNKYLTLNQQNWSASEKTLDMGSNGTSFVEIASNGAKPVGDLKMGKSNENNVILKDANADLSGLNFKDYSSTKDVVISGTALDKYASEGAAVANDSNKFISSEDGSFGEDIVAKSNSTFAASSIKGGLYATKYRQADIILDEVKDIDNEILVVAGASSSGEYDATKAGITTQLFALTNNNDAVADSVVGSKYNDVFVAGANDTVDGGAGSDKIYTNTQKVTVNLATGSTADQDTIYGWKTKTGAIQLADGKDFSSLSVATFGDNGVNANQFTVADKSGNKTFATFETAAALGEQILTSFKNGEGKSKMALIFDGQDDNNGTNAGVAADVDNVASAKLFVASGNGKNQINFAGTGKGNIFLGHSNGSDAEFGDTAQYVNVKNVMSDTVGSAWLFGGSTAATLKAGGDSDSLWGGGSGADTLISNAEYRTFFGTTHNGGIDEVRGFKTGADAFGETPDTDVIYFVDGVDLSTMKIGKNKAGNGQFIVGSDSTSGLALDLNSMDGDTSNGALITYALGFDGKKNVAKVDVTADTTANGEITFEEDAKLYIGRGDKTTLTFGSNNGNAVRFGFDSEFGGYNIRNLNGSDAVEGSIINGSTDRAQIVTASEKGASYIAGGFNGEFKDANSDTLVGGNEDDFGTMFVVGKDLGSDQILKLSGNDTVVFINTKVSDITSDVNANTYGKTMSVAFNTGSRVTINSDNNIADLENVTLQLDDGKFTYDAVSKSWVQA